MAPVVFSTGSEGTISRGSAEGLEICKLRRQAAGKKYRSLGALELLDLKIFGPLNRARIAYEGEDHPFGKKKIAKRDGQNRRSKVYKPGNRCEK